MRYLLLFLYSTSLFANVFTECGHYNLDGKLNIINNELQFTINIGSDAESVIQLSKLTKQKLSQFYKININAEIIISKNCEFSCVGKLVIVNRILNVFDERPKDPFSPYKGPHKKLSCIK